MAGAWRDRFTPLVVGVTGSFAKTSTKEAAARSWRPRCVMLKRGQREQRDRPAADAAAARSRARGRRARDGHVRGRRHRGPGRAWRAQHRRRHRRPRRAPRARRLAGDHRARARASWSRPCRPTARPSSTPTIRRVRRMAARSRGARPDLRLRARRRRERDRDVESLGTDGMRFRPPDAGRRGATSTTPALGRHSVHNALAAAAVGPCAGLDADDHRRRPGRRLQRAAPDDARRRRRLARSSTTATTRARTR